LDLSVSRLLTLLELLQAHRRLSAADIAARLEVDPRTVRRYIAGLQEMGIPVQGERGPAGGYRLRAGYKLPPLMFNDEEALAVVLGLLAVQRLGLVRESQALSGALAKLDRVLPDGLRKRMRALQDVLGLQLNPIARGSADAEVVLAVSSAASDGSRLRLDYKDARGQRTERLVDPYGVTFQSGAWYVAGHDHLRGELRTFRLDRVMAAEPTRESFERPKGFDVVEHVQRMLAEIPYGWTAEVVLHAPPAVARKRVPRSLGTLEPTEEAIRTRLRIGADDLDWVARYLAELPFEFTVEKPPELREAVLRVAERLQRGARA
jgi:predicted DNA-binding transcriptional regulator YafY